MRIRLALAIAIVLISSSFSFAQQKDDYYSSRWKLVDSFQQKGLTASALEVVNEIYSTSQKEKNSIQFIRAFQFRVAFEMKEGGIINQLLVMENEAAEAGAISRAVLYSAIAQHYWMYLQGTRYRLYDRTTTVNFVKDDIETWGFEDLHRKITELYLQSLAEKTLLQHTLLDSLEGIVWPGNARYLRPTLYDLLAHRAIDYFANDERYLSKPAFAFEISQPQAFANAATFAKHHFINTDSLSHAYHALALYQELTAFHLNDSKPNALIDLDIHRLKFMHDKSVLGNKDSLYEAALHAIVEKYPLNKEAALAWYRIAQMYKDRADRYQPLSDTSYRYELVKAKAFCEKGLMTADSSEGKYLCELMLNEILEKYISLKTEKVNLPGQPFRTLVQYRNIPQLHLRLVRIPRKFKNGISNEIHWKKLLKLHPVRSYVQPLPDPKDYRLHSVEIKIDALPVGEYVLIASSDEKFAMKSHAIYQQKFYVSRIGYINNGNDFFVLDRETGHPIKQAKVQVWNGIDNPNEDNAVYWKREGTVTDSNGFFQIKPLSEDDFDHIKIEVTTKNDHLFMKDDDESVETIEEPDADRAMTAKEFEEEDRYTYLFTDRSIYRPGQLVYFKGIMTTRDFITGKSKIVAGKKSKVFLVDSNDEPVDSLEVTSNEFGSFSGKFHLPQNRLNGDFTIEEQGEVSFSVEEYKRPKFYVGYDKPSGSYRLNDTLEITGYAKAFAGYNIDGASVKYRVTRTTRFIYSSAPWRSPQQVRDEQEITNGEVQTGADGKFKVRFAAIPDLSVRKEHEPVFDYSVTADITDANGETHSATTFVSASYKALQLKFDLPQSLPVDSFRNIPIETTNFSDEPVPAQAKVVVHRLKVPPGITRSRYWEQPDQFIFSKEEYKKYFPYDEYSNETDMASWQRIQKVFEKTDSTSVPDSYPDRNRDNFKIPVLSPGWYVVEVTVRDNSGELVKNLNYIELISSPGIPITPNYQWELPRETTAQPGETATLELGSSAKDVFVIQVMDKDPERFARNAKRDKYEYSFLTIDSQKISLPFVVKEEDRGNFFVHHTYVKHNRFYSSEATVKVPWSNKDLHITYETFRDKTLPGSQEKWKVKLSGEKKEKVAAEMLTAMYDASLDEFNHHEWELPDVWSTYSSSVSWTEHSFETTQSVEWINYNEAPPYPYFNYGNLYDQLAIGYKVILNVDGSYRAMGAYGDWNGLVGKPTTVQVPDWRSDPDGSKGVMKDTIILDDTYGFYSPSSFGRFYMNTGKERGATKMAFTLPTLFKPQENKPIQVRKNFNETAFFFPDLKTDSAGNIEFSFTMPEALTKWKWMVLSHSKDLAMGYSEKTLITQKQLMVQPNMPRFLREGDRIDLSAKIVNMSDKEIKGDVSMQFIDAETNLPLTGWLKSIRFTNFIVAAGQSTPVKFTAVVPYQFNKPVLVRFVAQSGELSDGEENAIPVITNRMMVTESIPLNVRGEGTKNFRFDKLLKANNSKTLSHHAVTLEFTSNPAWYALQSLPYLMQFPYECAEQLWNRVYSNTLAAKIVNSSPRVKQVLEKWRTEDTSALISNLQKNEELKSVLLQETPWVLDAKNETKQKQNLAAFFSLLKLGDELEKNLMRLKQKQLKNGAFSWFGDQYEDRYITQYILSGIGHLKKLDAMPAGHETAINEIVENGLRYLDKKIKEDYDRLVKNKTDLKKNNLGYYQVGYLYMRSFFKDIQLPEASKKAYNYFRDQAKQFWLQQNKYMQGMIALALHRMDDAQTPQDILKSLKQNAVIDKDKGMYWKTVNFGYYWYEAPIETQALLIEAFTDITNDLEAVNDLKTWLLKNKQTNNWSTTKATAEACYALLLQGTDWLNSESAVQVTLGDRTVNSLDEKTEAGTGYFKKMFDASSVNNSMGNISVYITPQNKNSSIPPSWGAVYWQYFENLENITSASTPLKLSKKLFIERNTDRGPVLEPVGENGKLKVGDKVKIRIELRVDRDMEYVHMKDMRASALEPVNVISSYKWQDGLGYYESTKDASTNFFFNYLPKGTYVFEYPLFVTHTGSFSNGVTTIQCMYAPEFSSHSEGIRINVE